MTQEITTDSTMLAVQRTYMAAERTFYAVLRTGLAIAAGGTVIVRILGDRWPEWLSLLLSGVFIVVGYTMILVSLNTYRKAANKLKIEHDLDVMSPKLTITLTIILQAAVAIVLGLALLRIFAIPGQF